MKCGYPEQQYVDESKSILEEMRDPVGEESSDEEFGLEDENPTENANEASSSTERFHIEEDSPERSDEDSSEISEDSSDGEGEEGFGNDHVRVYRVPRFARTASDSE